MATDSTRDDGAHGPTLPPGGGDGGEPPDPRLGQVLAGTYELLAVIGRGANGTVYRARDLRLRRDVAIKLLRARSIDETQLRRFEREARLTARLDHPALVTLHDIGYTGEQPFLVLELCDGTSLDRRLATRGVLPVEEAIGIARDVASALGHAHTRGIVHRDVKPANILLPREGPAKLGDFGIARALFESTLTADGETIGTPAYMSPEQVRGERVAAASDVFSLGVVLYEMLTGARPFRGGSTAETWSQILHRRPEDLERRVRGLPSHLARTVRACLEKDADRRFTDGGALLAALDGGPLPRTPTRLGWLVVALVVVLGSVIALDQVPGMRRAGWRGSEVWLRSGLGRELWREDLGEPVVHALRVGATSETADVVLAATFPGRVFAVRDGTVQPPVDLASQSPYPERRTEWTSRLYVLPAGNHRPPRALVAMQSSVWWESVVAMTGIQGPLDLSNAFWNSGLHYDAPLVSDLDEDGWPEVAVLAHNNHLGYCPVVFMLDSKAYRGQSPPYRGRTEREFGVDWYTFLPGRSAVRRISSAAGQLVLWNDSGEEELRLDRRGLIVEGGRVRGDEPRATRRRRQHGLDWLREAESLVRRKQLEGALDDLRRGLEVLEPPDGVPPTAGEPQDVLTSHLHLRCAQLLLELGRADEARHAFREALAAAARCPTTVVPAARFALVDHRIDEARALAAILSARDYTPWTARFELLVERFRQPAAPCVLPDRLEFLGSEWILREHCGIRALDDLDPRRALAELETAVELNLQPSRSTRLAIDAARLETDGPNAPAEVRTRLEETAASEPGWLFTSTDVARALLALGRPVAALEKLATAARSEPEARLLLPKARLGAAEALAGEDPPRALALAVAARDDDLAVPAIRAAATSLAARLHRH